MRFDFVEKRFVEIAELPNKYAVIDQHEVLTWKEFHGRVLEMVGRLAAVEKGHPVLIYGHKEANFVVAITACLILELPYIPVDSVFPLERMIRIREIAGASVVYYATEDRFEFYETTKTWAYNADNPLTYIIFTSGSTGDPKGVMLGYRGIVKYLDWIHKKFPFDSRDVFSSQIPFSFDLSTYELFSFLDFGATIALFSRAEVSDPNAFIAKLKATGATVWNTTPSAVMMHLINREFNSSELPNLTKFFFAGEQIASKTVKFVKERFKGSYVYNSYGPTEATNTVTFVELGEDILDSYSGLLPIGYPKFNSQIKISDPEVDASGNLVGELHLGGDNVALGYVGNEKLNAEKFYVEDGVRFFKSGDYGYYRNGMLFFVGRHDDMIKLNGFRIEIDEIEFQILETDLVEACKVIPLIVDGKASRLIACFVPKGGMRDSDEVVERIRKQLKTMLPYYMIPNDFFAVASMPTNSNGKVDKKALLKQYIES